MNRERLLWALRSILASVLIAAGVLKAGQGVVVVDATIPAVLALPLAGAVPWIEIAVGLLLLSEKPRPGAWACLVLCSAFVGVTSYRIAAEGWSPDCGCFGALRTPLDGWHLALNIMLLAMSAVTVRGLRKA
jgi:hypothetical protein